MNWFEVIKNDPLAFFAAFCTFLVLSIAGYIYVVTRDMTRHFDGVPEPPHGDVPNVPKDAAEEIASAAAFHAATLGGRN